MWKWKVLAALAALLGTLGNANADIFTLR